MGARVPARRAMGSRKVACGPGGFALVLAGGLVATAGVRTMIFFPLGPGIGDMRDDMFTMLCLLSVLV